jgi:hypothetical protein
MYHWTLVGMQTHEGVVPNVIIHRGREVHLEDISVDCLLVRFRN